ncbi:RNA-binding protein lark [Eumeta japonica]|uniref:RNA-binding protein lark n=1 Tax=Eumeta variegata TaxID=151549 RepID=A0A4C1UD50_EUMVA|nr:RNA-binding protein lark [Eumeta japonica]
MVPQTKVFVGSLPHGSRPEDLRKLFERFGVVTECDIMNRCGFVHMQTEDQATAAIRALHNTTFNGGVITVERGRIKERGQRGPGGPRGGMRGGMRNGMEGGIRRLGGGGPMRGPPMGGRDAPYMRDARPMGPMRGGDMRGPPMGGAGMVMRNGMSGGGAPYDRSLDRPMASSGGYPDDRYGGYGGEDRRGFALMDGRGARSDPYGAPAPMYDDRRGYATGGIDEIAPMYPDDRRATMYPDERDMMDRRAPMRGGPIPITTGYDRAPPRPAPMGNGDMYSRRSPPSMRGGAGAVGGYDRDPYQQPYTPMGRKQVCHRAGSDLGCTPGRATWSRRILDDCGAFMNRDIVILTRHVLSARAAERRRMPLGSCPEVWTRTGTRHVRRARRDIPHHTQLSVKNQ